MSDATSERLLLGASISDDELNAARAVRTTATAVINRLFESVDVIVIPSTPTRAPLLNDVTIPITACTRFANMLGLPALSIPVAVPEARRTGPDAHLPASMQIIGRAGADEYVCAVGRLIESSTT